MTCDPEVEGLRAELSRLRAENDKLRLALAVRAPPELVWVCTDQPKLRVFASEDAANRHFASHDPEGVAFACEVEQ